MSVLAKPLYGQPCNGCGVCCKDQRCPLGARVFGPGADCPALTEAGCGLVLEPVRYAPDADRSEMRLRESATMLIGAGMGCDAQLLGEPDDPVFRERLRAWARRHGAKARRTLQWWPSLRPALGERAP